MGIQENIYLDSNISYMDFELESVDGDKFKLSDFENDVVLVESFAIWCPTCLAQQQEIEDLHNLGNNFISIKTNENNNNCRCH